MIELSTDKRIIGPWICEKIGRAWAPQGRETVGLVRDDGTVLAGIIFEDATPVCMTCHIAIDNPHVPVRRLLTGAAHYAFNQCGVNKLLAFIRSDNLRSLSFNMRIGFKAEAIIKDVFPKADLVVLSMLREDCKFIPRVSKAA